MAVKMKLCLTLFLFSVLVLCTGFALATEEPEHLRRCRWLCDRQGGDQQQMLCRQRCQDRYGKEKGGALYNKHKKDSEEEEENPYVFQLQDFTKRDKTGHGSVYSLPEFTQRSKLLYALQNYRLGILVTDPRVFLSPNHMDADSLMIIAGGRGTITIIRQHSRESINVERGDIINIPAGTHFYLVNSDDNEKLYIVKFIRILNLPGHFKVYHGAGGLNPDSFFRAFSHEILEAAFKSKRDEVDRLFSREGEGILIKASKEQIQALSQSGGGPSIGTLFNLFKKRPTQSNNYGQLIEVDSDDFGSLQDLNILVSYFNISKGAMATPFYNSKTTTVAVAVAGEGDVEIASPHIPAAPNGTQGAGTTFLKLRSHITTNTVVIIPVGHPFVIVASKNNNLELACFEINAKGNIRYPLAGRRNIVSLMHKEAKELSFRTTSQEVDQVFGIQQEEFFFPGPTGPHEEGGDRAYE